MFYLKYLEITLHLFLFADDTNVTVTHFNHTDFNKEITSVFIQVKEWFAANLLFLN
jgi:hypothetical protein